MVEEKEEYSPRNCDRRFLDLFKKNPEMKESARPSKEMERLCPEVKDSCCSASEFDDFLQQILQKQFILGKTKSNLINLVTWIVSLSDKEMNDMVQLAHEKNCVSPEGTPLMVSRSTLKEEFSSLETSLKKSFNFFFRLGTGFACTLCQQGTHNHFEMHESGKGFGVKVSDRICDSIFLEGSSEGHLRVFYLMSLLNVFSEMLGCMAEDPLKLEPSFDKKQFDDLQQKALFCSSQKKWVSDSDCFQLCNRFQVINQNVFSEMMVSAEKALLYSRNWMNEYRDTKEKLVKGSGKQLLSEVTLDSQSVQSINATNFQLNLPSYIPSFRYFVEPLGGESSNSQMLTQALTHQNGLDPSTWQMLLVSKTVSNILFSFVFFFAILLF